MSEELLGRRLSLLAGHLPLLNQCLRGIERESLRVTTLGSLAHTPHPRALGAALTHKQITTDYSESLLEFITPALTDPADTLESLDALHRFAYTSLGDELLWSASMPCMLPSEEEIPIAEYGSSHVGRLKHVYRRGLALRYGRSMQCIAGIHYNFSLPQEIWSLWRKSESIEDGERELQSSTYMGLIRNFRRYGWLLLYLFGASPALNANFLRGRPHQLEQFDTETLYLPSATSLRMSDLGYQSNAQAGIMSCHNSLTSYADTLRRAVGTPYRRYEEIGTHHGEEWVQLNTNILQIENEYYSSIRPKCVARAGERPIEALIARGVQYVEVRALDINPLFPLGIDLPQARFLDAFLLFCALSESPPMTEEERAECDENHLAVAKEGRDQRLRLRRGGRSISLRDWSNRLLMSIAPVADLMDHARRGDKHRQALQDQCDKVDDPSLTPSAQVLATMRESSMSFDRFALRQSQQHAESFRQRKLPIETLRAFESMADESILAQKRLEEQDTGSFDQFLSAYQTSILPSREQSTEALT
nr:glutamate--cysteine ligase [uncultured Cupriavidus sp.]